MDHRMSGCDGYKGKAVSEDMVLQCGSDFHNVHSVIFRRQSSWFAAIIADTSYDSFGMKHINMEDKDPYMAELIVEYMYEQDYTIEFDATMYCNPMDSDVQDALSAQCDQELLVLENNPAAAPSQSTEAGIKAQSPTHMVVHAMMYNLAIHFDIYNLKELARRKFKMCAKAHRTSPVFPIALREVWMGEDEDNVGLKDIVVDILASEPELWKLENTDELLRELPGLGLAVFNKRGGGRDLWGVL
ncbi:hypothetical protein BDV96DRAFT_590106 [Lophiotrema nucula]|uniref:BTB domain-containing protein n=1 Tax=Lophiotrema nucula TaxID=690887 RepID=A0A6A5YLQ3_9PLEO|nr:hypothetical protein BDV96DRAFT_590106 [Lophiotrema nucula]